MKLGNGKRGPRVWITIVVLAVVLTFLLPPFYGCGTKAEFLVEQMVKASEGATISSADNRITLEIPPDALSENTRVKLSNVPEDEWPEDIKEIEPLGLVYRLEPDGIELGKPATLTIRLEPDDVAGLELPEGALPLCIALTRNDNGEWDIVQNPLTTVDTNTGDLLVTAETAHFSWEVLRYTTMAVSFTPEEVRERMGTGCWPVHIQIHNFGHEKASIKAIEPCCTFPVKKCTVGYDVTGRDLLPGEKWTSKIVKFTCEKAGHGHYGIRISVKTSASVSMLEVIYGSIEEGEASGAPLWKEGWVSTRVMRAAFCEEITYTPPPIPEPSHSLEEAEETIDEPEVTTAGIGAHLTLDENGKIIVLETLPGASAYTAGIKAGDWIIGVDGMDTQDMDIYTVASMIMGPVDTKVTITLVRSGQVLSFDCLREPLLSPVSQPSEPSDTDICPKCGIPRNLCPCPK